MEQLLILSGEIVGRASSAQMSGRIFVDDPDPSLPIQELRNQYYWNGERIVSIPNPPSPDAIWDKTHWVQPSNEFEIDPNAPNWDGFRSSIILNSTWEAVLNQSPALASTIVSLWSRADVNALNQIVQIWNLLAQRYHTNTAFTLSEIEGLNAIANTNNIPVSLDGNGQMTILVLEPSGGIDAE